MKLALKNDEIDMENIRKKIVSFSSVFSLVKKKLAKKRYLEAVKFYPACLLIIVVIYSILKS